MDAYIYQAALLCPDCARNVMGELVGAISLGQINPADNNADTYPQGPYSDGGGEADCPQHCDHCGVFLENPLTTDGIAYVEKERTRREPFPGIGVVKEWTAFYGIDPRPDPIQLRDNGQPRYCDPWNTGLASTDRAVCSRISRLLTALGDEINSHGVKGQIAEDVRTFRLHLIDKLQADGWTMSYDGGNRLKVRQPGHRKPFPKRG